MEPDERSWGDDLDLDGPGARRFIDLFFRPQRYFAAYAPPPGRGATALSFWSLAFAVGLDNLELRYVLNPNTPGAQESWSYLFGYLAGAALFQALILYGLAGWWYGVRIRWSRPRTFDGSLARKVYGSSALTFVLPYLLCVGVAAAIYDRPADYFESESWVWLLILLFPLWAIYTSYRGVMTIFRPRFLRALMWFFVLPLGIQGTCFSVATGLGAWVALFPQAQTASPSSFSSRTLDFDYPGNWTIDQADPDYDPQTYIVVEPPQDAIMKIQYYESWEDPEWEIDATVDSLRRGFTGLRDTGTFKMWGRTRGEGRELSGVTQGEEYTLRIFVGSVARGLMLEVLEVSRPSDHGRVGPGFALIRRTLTTHGKKPRPTSPIDLDDLISGLGDDDPSQRDGAINKLEELGRTGFSVEQGIHLLRAATGSFPPQERDVQEALVSTVALDPDPDFVDGIVEGFDRYSIGARHAALEILAELESRKAARALIDLMEEHAETGGINRLPTGTLDDHPRHADVLFPEIMTHAANPRFAWEVHLLALRYLERDALGPDVLREHLGPLLERYRAKRAWLAEQERPDGVAWMWTDDYQDARSWAALWLDLLGQFPEPEIEEVLKEAAESRDPRLVYFAVEPLLDRSLPVPPSAIDTVADSLEMRESLFKLLRDRDRLDLFPERHRNQRALAASDLARWLTYPTELGTLPTELELMDVIIRDRPEGGPLEYYVFRFRGSETSDRQWMAGVAGGYASDEAPTTTSTGETFSQFTPWDGTTSSDHLDAILEKLRESRSP